MINSAEQEASLEEQEVILVPEEAPILELKQEREESAEENKTLSVEQKTARKYRAGFRRGRHGGHKII